MRIVKNILFWLTTVCLLFAIILLAVPRLFGVEFRAVKTGSMTPDIPVGSLVVIVPTAAEDIKIGDDITFVTAGDTVVTHRVIEIDREKNEFITWGIANDESAVDAPNKYENVLGVVRLHIPIAGLVFTWLATLQGKIIAATVIIAIYIISCIFGVLIDDKKRPPAALVQAPPSADISLKNDKLFDDLKKSFDESNAMFSEDAYSFLKDGPSPSSSADGDNSLLELLEKDEEIKKLLEDDELLKSLL